MNSIVWDYGDVAGPEALTQRAILDYFILKGYFHWRNNSGAMKTAHSFVRFGAEGSPDIFLIKAGTLWGIEVKAPDKYLKPAQKVFRDGMEKAGAKYLLARSLDDVMAAGL